MMGGMPDECDLVAAVVAEVERCFPQRIKAVPIAETMRILREGRKAKVSVSGNKPVLVRGRTLRGIGQRCAYCPQTMQADGKYQVTRDHVLPQHLMRKVEADRRVSLRTVNMVLACRECNERKGGVSLFKFVKRYSDRRNLLGRMLDDLRKRIPSDADFLLITGLPDVNWRP
jgi:hypothetical protein